MTSIKTYAVGIIAAIGIAAAALTGAGIASATTDPTGPNVELHADQPASSSHSVGSQIAPNHAAAVRNYAQGGASPAHTRHHHAHG